MTVFRNRKTIRAEQYRTGKKIEGVHVMDDGCVLLDCNPAPMSFMSVKFVEIKDCWYVLYNSDGSRHFAAPESFERDWENVGG